MKTLLPFILLLAAGCTATRVTGSYTPGEVPTAKWKLTRLTILQDNQIGDADLKEGNMNAYKNSPDEKAISLAVSAAVKAALAGQ